MTSRIKAAGAALVLLGLVVGLPAVLIAIGAIPFPSSVPTLDEIGSALTSPDDGSLFLGVLAAVAWLAWIVLATSVLVELISTVRGIQPPDIRGLGTIQSMVRPLVVAAVMLVVTAPVSGAIAQQAQAAPSDAAAAVPATPPSPVVPTGSAESSTTEHSQRPEAEARTTYTVQPGDSLWRIAEKHLGDGEQYPRIVAANPDILDGAGFLRPGWELELPAPKRSEDSKPSETVTVQRGDTLSGIAERHLGDPSAWPEIVEASQEQDRPGIAPISNPDLIYPGQVVRIPDGASSPDLPERPHQKPLSHRAEPPSPAAPSPAAPATATPPATAVREDPSPSASEADGPDDEGELLDESSHDWPTRTAAGVGALMAAGVVGLIAARRRTQQRRRLPGEQIAMPAGQAARTEAELRVVADQLSVEAVDRALRGLAKSCAAAGAPLPLVRAARLTGSQFDLYLEEPRQLPDPWTGTADATVWTLEVENAADLDDVSDTPSPWPALVTVGHDPEGGHVFVDLEYLGALGIRGEATDVRAILAALAIELATSSWADDLRITIVGAYAELEDVLQTGRVRYVPTAAGVLDELETRAEQDRHALADAGAEDLQHARVTGAAPGAWTPEIVIITTDLTDRQRNQIANLITEVPRVAVATISPDVSAAEWAIDLTAVDDPEFALLQPFGLQIRPQRVDAEDYEHLLEIAATTDDPASPPPSDVTIPAEPTLADLSTVQGTAPTGVDAETEAGPAAVEPGAGAEAEPPPPAIAEPGDESEPASELADPGDAGLDETEEDAQVKELPVPPPEILVLGEPELLNAGGSVEKSKRARLLELAAFIALNPGASAQSIDDAIWPSRKVESNLNTRNTATSKLRSWLGQDPSGQDYLPRHQSGGYRLAGVTTDLERWTALLPDGPWTASTENLEQALRLVRGRPFSGRHPRYYTWSEAFRQRLITEIADTSYELARRRLMDGRWSAAQDAATAGLLVEPVDERLWRMRILAAHEAHTSEAEKVAIERLLTLTAELELELEPETLQLLEAIKDPNTGLSDLLEGGLG